jgi:hypothetical protein
MWKKIMLLAAGMLAIVVLTTGIMTMVNADTGSGAVTPPAGPPPGRGFPGQGNSDMMAKVAAKLGIDQQKLEDAFKAVMLEEQQQRTNDMFAAWVKDGKLTQAQADAYLSWLNAKPADMPGFPFFGDAKATGMLDKLLADGRITQAQYDAWKAWIALKPAVDLPRPEKPAGGPPPGGPPCRGNAR